MGLGFFFAAALTAITGNQLTAFNSERIGLHRPPLVMTITTECLIDSFGFPRRRKAYNVTHRSVLA